jgi:hypothetical protein
MTEGYDTSRLPVGTPVRKVGGDYEFPGTIVAAFKTSAGAERFVVEATGEGCAYRGMLHIFNGAQLRVDAARLPEARGIATVLRAVKCKSCHGTGRAHGALSSRDWSLCSRCNGAGFVTIAAVVAHAD